MTADYNTVPVAVCEVRWGSRAMLLCSKHTFAVLEQADDSDTQTEINLLTQAYDLPCTACWAVSAAGYPDMFVPD